MLAWNKSITVRDRGHDHASQETCSTHAIATGIGHCDASLLVLAQRRDAIPYVLSGLSDAIEVAVIRQLGRDSSYPIDDQAIRLRATHQLVECARIDNDETRRTAFSDGPELPRLDDRL